MIEKSIARLQYLCDIIPPMLNAMDPQAFEEKPSTGKWSKKQIIGHLIDSATNNHQRFVRGQFENEPVISYDQDQWNKFGFYDQIGAPQVIAFWTTYNTHLVQLIQQIPKENLLKKCSNGIGEKFSIAWLIDDYVAHLEHHLKQVVSY